MTEKTPKQRMEGYINKQTILGVHQFDFEYHEYNDTVSITHIYGDGSRDVLIPCFVSRIDFWAWFENKDMKNCKIMIPKGCTIEFEDCALKPTWDSFAEHVREIEVEKGHEEYVSKDGVLFNKDKSVLLVYPRDKESAIYTVPNSVVKIKDGAFMYNDTLEKLNLSKNIIEIGECNFHANTKINVNNENMTYKSVRGSLYSKDGRVLYHIHAKNGSSIIIEDGTVLIKNTFPDGTYYELYLPSSIKPMEGFFMITDKYVAIYDIITAPKRLRKYLKHYEKYCEVNYY